MDFRAAAAGFSNRRFSATFTPPFTNGPGTLSYWWKVSCDTNTACLRLYVNGSERARISGEVDWTNHTFDLTSGDQLLQWKYYKSNDVTAGADRAWLDRVAFVPSVLSNRTSTVAIFLKKLNQTAALTWPADSNVTYQLLYKDTVAEEWRPLGANVSITGAVARAVDPTCSGSQRFYRVVRSQ